MSDEDQWAASNRRDTSSVWRYVKFVTVEPTMVLYMLAFMTTSVVEQAFFVNRACRVDHNLTADICDNLTADANKEINKQVQITVSTFHLWNDIAGHLGQIVLAFFMGAWSDKRGRKIPLLLGLTGKLYYSLMFVVNTLQTDWPLDYVIYTATLPMAFTGADVAIFAAAVTYVVDVCSPENRTVRVTLLEVCYLATMPIGIALGSFLFRGIANRSYTTMFTINVALLVLAILYSLVRLRWRTTARQRPLSEAPNILLDFFDLQHVVGTGKALFKPRGQRRRTYLLLLILAMGLYVFQRDERNMSYLYAQLAFKWDLGKYSDFRTVQSAVQDVFLLLAIPVMSRLLGWRDTVIIMIGAMAHAVARLFYGLAQTPEIFYVGGMFAALGPIVAPVIRSMVSKLVATSEKGKTLSVLSAADNAIPLISGTLYSQLYNATIHTHPESIFYLTMATQLAVFLLMLFVHVTAKDEYLTHEDQEVKSECLQQNENEVNE